MRKRLVIVLSLLTLPFATSAGDELAEVRRVAPRYLSTDDPKEVDRWTEHVLPDRTRVDLLTPLVAYEADWAYKWAEAVGQSVYYSIETERRPGIILLVRDWKKDRRHVRRCRKVCDKLGIILAVEVVDAGGI